jgi:hypothetical protein
MSDVLDRLIEAAVSLGLRSPVGNLLATAVYVALLFLTPKIPDLTVSHITTAVILLGLVSQVGILAVGSWLAATLPLPPPQQESRRTLPSRGRRGKSHDK